MMAESELHLSMVKRLKSNVINEFGAESLIIFSDDGLKDSEPPPLIGGTRPDLYANDPITDFHIVGEAKTETDLLTTRSKKQIYDQLEFLSHKTQHLYILLVPFGSLSTGRSIVRECKLRLCSAKLDSRVLEYRDS